MRLTKFLGFFYSKKLSTAKQSSFKYYWSIGKGHISFTNSSIQLSPSPILGQNDTFFGFRTDGDVIFRDYFVCDPFLIKGNGEWILFFEICGYLGDKYVTAIAKVDVDLDFKVMKNFSVIKYADDKPNMNRTFTISYPYPIVSGGVLYLILEEYSQKSVTTIYRFNQNTNVLLPVAELPIRILDPNIQEVEGLIWVYGVDEDYAIRVFVASEIFGPFVEHHSSGKYSGKSFARNAGAVFIWNKSMIRPFQDCSESYGKALGFSEIRIDADSGFEIVRNDLLDNLSITGSDSQPYWAMSKIHHFAVTDISSDSISGLIDAARKLRITNHGWMEF